MLISPWHLGCAGGGLGQLPQLGQPGQGAVLWGGLDKPDSLDSLDSLDKGGCAGGLKCFQGRMAWTSRTAWTAWTAQTSGCPAGLETCKVEWLGQAGQPGQLGQPGQGGVQGHWKTFTVNRLLSKNAWTSWTCPGVDWTRIRGCW